MATTTNYGWTTPDDTALVKDGAAAIRTLGSSVDTTTKALNPSTTLGDIEYRSSTANTNTRVGIGSSGQSLTVVAGVPSWAASPTSVLTTTGDTLYASSANTLARLGIGSTGNVLTVAGGVPTWAAPTAAGTNWSLVNAGGTALTGASTITVSGISGADQLFIIVESASAGASSAITWRLNADSGANYGYFGIEQTTSSLSGTSATADTSVFMTVASNNQASRIYGTALITGTNSAGLKMYQGSAGSTANGGTGQTSFVAGGYYTGTSTISSFSLISSVGNFDQGTLYVYKTA